MKTLTWKTIPSGERLDAVLRSWEGTPYCEGSQRKKAGVDCRHHVCGVADEMEGRGYRKLPKVAADCSLHNPAHTVRAMVAIAKKYEARALHNAEEIEAGDVLVTGPAGGGPGHVLICGNTPGIVWECGAGGVRDSGIGNYLFEGFRLFRTYRLERRDERWQK